MNYIDFEGYKKTEDKKKRTKELTELLSITKDNDQRQKIFKELREMAENGNK